MSSEYIHKQWWRGKENKTPATLEGQKHGEIKQTKAGFTVGSHVHRLGLADKCCLDFPRILQNTSITCVYQNLLSIIQREHTIWKYEQDIKGRRKNKFNTQKLKDELGPKEEEELLSDHLSLLNSYFSLSVFCL